MSYAPCYLVEVDALDPAGNPVTFYWSTDGYTTSPNDTPPNRHYENRINDPGSFVQSLYGERRAMGAAEVAYGEITLSNADDWVSPLRDHAIDGRAIRIKRLVSPRAPFSSAVTVLTGRMVAPDASDAWRYLKIGLYDRRLDLEKPLQSLRYAGTTVTADGTYEGNEDMKGTPKPLVFGRVRNIELPTVNVHQWLYQASSSPLTSVATYDGGSPRNPAGNFGTVAAALAASALYGRFTTCLAQGIIRFVGNASARPAFVFTADVVEGATLANRYPGAVAKRMLTYMGFTSGDIDAASFDALDAAAPYEVGIHVADEESGLSAISRLLGSVGAYIIPDAQGRFTVGRLAFTAPIMEIGENDIHPGSGLAIGRNPDQSNGIPPWRIVLQYQRNYRVMDKSSIAGCVGEEVRGFLGKEWRELKDDNTALQTRHPFAEELKVMTLLDKVADATTQLAWLKAMFGVDRDVMQFGMPMEAAPPIGSTVTLTLPKLGYQAGRDMIVIGRRDDFAPDLATLTAWG